MSWRALALSLSTLVLVATGIARVAWLEGQELRVVERVTLADLARLENATDESVRLAEVALFRDQEVIFELCSADAMPAERWTDSMALAVWRPRAAELMTRSELSAEVLALARRGPGQGCLMIGRGRIEEDDDYAVEALFDRWPETLDEVPLTVIVQARRPLSRWDAALVAAGWFCAVALVVALVRRRTKPLELDAWEAEKVAAAPPVRSELRLGIGMAALLGAYLLSGHVPGGAALALAAGVGLAIAQGAIAFGLAPGPGIRRRAEMLGVKAPPRAARWLAVAVASGVLLWLIALLATRLVPSTGVSAVSTFVSWPSGLLSFACLAVVVPLAEEIFFRGFVYGFLEVGSRALAFGGTWLLFVLAHAPQTWEQWGALLAIFVIGFGFTALRTASRSVLVPALAHLVYNGLLAVGALL